VANLKYPDPPLRDDLIALRPWREEDLALVVRTARDRAIKRWSHLPEPFDDAAVRKWFDAIPGQLAEGRSLRMLVVEPTDDRRLLGAVALFNVDAVRRSAEFGCWVAAASRGKGTAPRAAALIIGWAFDTLALESITAEVDADNRIAGDLVARGGFIRAGLVAQSEPAAFRYVLTAERHREFVRESAS